MSYQKTKPCSTCPWLKTSDEAYCFRPETLEKTVCVYLADGRVHPCHSNAQAFCAGYLSFAKYKKAGGLEAMGVASFGIEIGLIKPDEIENLDTFNSISDMLHTHRVRNDRIDLLDKGFSNERD